MGTRPRERLRLLNTVARRETYSNHVFRCWDGPGPMLGRRMPGLGETLSWHGRHRMHMTGVLPASCNASQSDEQDIVAFWCDRLVTTAEAA